MHNYQRGCFGEEGGGSDNANQSGKLREKATGSRKLGEDCRREVPVRNVPLE